MNHNRNRKGFTIVELVIVIAVIGILTAVLIPTFITLNARAQKAADESLVVNLNKALAISELDPKDTANEDLSDAAADLKDNGYLADVLITKSNEDLLYSVKKNRFLLSGDRNSSQYKDDADIDFYKIYQEMPETQTYSIAAGPQWAQSTIDNLSVGFDAFGHDEIDFKITYKNTTETAKETNIRTESAGSKITVDAPFDTIDQLGLAGESEIVRTASGSYHVKGTAGYVQVASGTVYADDGSIDTVVLIEKGAGASLPAAIKVKGSGTVAHKYAVTNDVASSNNAIEGTLPLALRNGSSQGDVLLTEEQENLSGEAKTTAIVNATFILKEDAVKAITPDPYKDAPEGAKYAYVADDGSIFYSKDELAEAHSGNEYTIVLLADAENEFQFIVNSTFTFDLHGHHLDLTSSSDGFGAVKSQVTIIDSVGNGKLTTCALEVMYDAKITVSSGFIEFTSGDSTVWGGEMASFGLGGPIVIEGGRFNANPTGHLAAGYTAVEASGIWSVVPA